MGQRTDTERLTDERDDLLARIKALEAQIGRPAFVRRSAYQRRAVRMEISASRLRLDEIEQELGWDDWREERRNSPIVL